MPEWNQGILNFPSFDRRKIEANFEGGNVSSDGGVILLRQVDRKLGLTQALDKVLPDRRDPEAIIHRQIDLLRQRIYGLALGYEDLNDHATLRDDLLWQSAVDRDSPLGSSPTLCRLENRVDRRAAWKIHKVLVEQFIASFEEPPEELILDFDATDDRVHGNQTGRFFHAYYGDWCFLPLYVFCGEQLLVAWLRQSNIDASAGTLPVLKRLVKRLREKWPTVRIILRGDSGFCRWKTFAWCDANQVDYIVGAARNRRLEAMGKALQLDAKKRWETAKQKQRLFQEFSHKAQTWDRKRRFIHKAEHTEKGSNPRFIVTSLSGDPQELYDTVYCARGEMENRIKEQQLGLFSDRTSCQKWWANQFRLLLSACAYVLMEAIRRLGLKGSELARAQVGTIRLKLLKLGTVIIRNTRRIRLLFSSAFANKELFVSVAKRFAPA